MDAVDGTVAAGCASLRQKLQGANRMMRMAGSHYINRDGESQGQVQIINADGPRYSAEELDAVLPPLPVAPQSRRKKLRTGAAPGLLQIADALSASPQEKVVMEPTAITCGSCGD